MGSELRIKTHRSITNKDGSNAVLGVLVICSDGDRPWQIWLPQTGITERVRVYKRGRAITAVDYVRRRGNNVT